MKPLAVARMAIDGVKLTAKMMANWVIVRRVGVKRFGRLQRAANLARPGVTLPFPLHS
jgi:hypothetical protein